MSALPEEAERLSLHQVEEPIVVIDIRSAAGKGISSRLHWMISKADRNDERVGKANPLSLPPRRTDSILPSTSAGRD